MGERGGAQTAVLEPADLRRDLLAILDPSPSPVPPAVRPPVARTVADREAATLVVAPPEHGPDLRRDLLTLLVPAGDPLRSTPPPPIELRRAPGRCRTEVTEARFAPTIDAPTVRRHRVVLEPVDAPAPARRRPGAGYRFVKACFDRLDAAILLVVLSPLLLVAMAAVKVTSPGPIFFRQERLGQGGRRFTMLKLRTMVCDAEEQLRRLGLYERYVEAGYKLPPEEDCRLTKVGRFLRRTSLDELPQLINVLRGDMSLVGPRPIVPPELECYGDRAECYLDVRPGLTGLWQVTGRSTITFPERGDIDAEYHARRSLWLDTLILLRTPMVVLRGTGAY